MFFPPLVADTCHQVMKTTAPPTSCFPNQTLAQIHNADTASHGAQQKHIMTQHVWISAINSLWEIAVALLKWLRFRAWVCERHFRSSRSDSTHLTAGMSAVCPDTPSEPEKKHKLSVCRTFKCPTNWFDWGSYWHLNSSSQQSIKGSYWCCLKLSDCLCALYYS